LAKRDPNWAPQLIVAAAIVLDVSLPSKLTIGPAWLLPAVEGLLLAALLLFSSHPNTHLRRRIAIALIGLVSAVNVFSLVELCHYLLKGGKTGGHQLILAGSVLWATNVLLFGLWYWQLDRGGPLLRAGGAGELPDFLFPQMDKREFAPPGWMPTMLDYLYVSFTNATAFSPTDTMPLSVSAKLLMAVQSLASLVTVGLVVARAVNILS
jgi:hypothetical protein